MGRGGLGQLRNRYEETTPYVDPRLKVMERFQDFLSPENRDGHMFPKGAYGR